MEHSKGKVIPFAQGAKFYMKRGDRVMERNDMLGALRRYRLAHQAAPAEPGPALALAEILSNMQRYEESNRLLFQLLAHGNAIAECHYGLACNYFGMREYDYAARSLERYLDLEPNGAFAPDAEDFLDMLGDDQAMYEVAGLKDDADYDANAACLYAQRLMDRGDYRQAVDLLKRESVHEPNSLMLKNQLALAYICNGERGKAAGVTQEILDSGKADVHTRYNYALLCLSRGDRRETNEAVDALLREPSGSPEALHCMAALLLETERCEEAADVLERLVKLCPYDANAWHMLGCCRYRLGDAPGAQSCYKRLLCIDPADTVAKYYLSQCRAAEPDIRRLRLHWAVAYRVPFGETLRRLAQINRSLQLRESEQRELWQNDRDFVNLLKWALTLPDNRVKRSVLSLLYLYSDECAEGILRDFLLRTEQPDELKHMVFGMLRNMGAKEPYMTFFDGRWIQWRASFYFSYPLPVAYASVLHMLLQSMAGVHDDECLERAANIFKRYIESVQPNFPRISYLQAASLAAALEMIGCKPCEAVQDMDILCDRYRITPTRLRNALVKLAPVALDKEDAP